MVSAKESILLLDQKYGLESHADLIALIGYWKYLLCLNTNMALSS